MNEIELLKPESMFGTLYWAGQYREHPAIVLSYSGGAALWAFVDDKWTQIAKTSGCDDPSKMVPSKCKYCGTELPRPTKEHAG